MTKLNLYIISQSINTGYDTFDGAVVAAPDMETARRMHPEKCPVTKEIRYIPSQLTNIPGYEDYKLGESDWVTDPEDVVVEFIGVAEPFITHPTIISASYNAG